MDGSTLCGHVIGEAMIRAGAVESALNSERRSPRPPAPAWINALAIAGPIVLAVFATVAALLPGVAAADSGFSLGVSAGEIRPHAARIWTRANDSGPVTAQVATDSRFAHVVAQRSLDAEPAHDLTVQTTVRSLSPDRIYRYRFCAHDGCSRIGNFRTAPRRSQNREVKFAFTGDTDATAKPGATRPFFGGFGVFRSMRRQHNDFNVHLGDTMYAYSEVPGVPPAITLEQKWRRYKDNLRQKALRRVRASAGFYSQWDDREFGPDGFTIPRDGRAAYDVGAAAFRDYAPVSYTNADGLYRTFRWGRNVELFFLDEVSFRSAEALTGGVCDNPDTPGQPDLAPTAPKSVRELFAVTNPEFSEPVSQACKDAIDDPSRTLLGKRQLRKFLHDVKHSKARWKVVMSEDPIQQSYVLNPYYAWQGYAHERIELLNKLQRMHVRHLVFLSAASHADYANVVRERTIAGDVAPSNAPRTAPADTPYTEFSVGPADSITDWQQIDRHGGAGSGAALGANFLKPPPRHDGLGMLCAQGDVRSYAEVIVKADRLRVAYKNAHGHRVRDVFGYPPCGPYVLRANGGTR